MTKERIFLHYKGNQYKLLGFAQHSETLEEMVIYQALYGDKKIWVRPYSIFFSKVYLNGVEIDRFEEI